MSSENNGKNMQIAQFTMDKDENKEKQEKKSIWSIDKEMLRYKLHYFLFIGGMSATLPYLPVFAKTRIGMSATSLGIVNTIQQSLIILFKPVIGYLADYFNKLKAIIVILTIIQGIFLFLILPIPNLGRKEVHNLNESHIYFPGAKFYDYKIYYKNEYENFEISNSNIFSCAHLKKSKSFDDILHTVSTQVFNDSSLEDYIMVFLVCSGNVSQSEDLSTMHESVVNSTILNKVPSPSSLNLCFSQHVNANLSRYHDNEYNFSFCYTGIKKISMLDMINLINLSGQPVYVICSNSTDNFLIPEDGATENITNGEQTNLYRTYQFWMFVVILIIINLAINALFTLADTACYESLEICGAQYGRQRVWGAVSWGIIAPFAGFLIDYTKGYLAPWCLMVACCVLQIWNITKMNLTKPHLSPNILKDVRAVFSSMEFIAFEIGVFMTGVSTGYIWFYLSWFIESIGGSSLLIGLAHTVQCFFGEMPFMFYSGWIIQKIGHFNVVTMSLLGHSIRFFWYSYLQNPWMLLPIECIHGITYGVFYAALTSYAKISAKPGTEATTQSVLCITYEGFGAGLGCVIAGIGFDRFGGKMTFYYGGIIWLFATFINIISTLMVKRRRKALNVANSLKILTVNELTEPDRF